MDEGATEDAVVTVDAEACVGTGQCEMVAPAVFTVGDEGVAEVDPVAASSAETALLRRATRNCPTGAITHRTQTLTGL